MTRTQFDRDAFERALEAERARNAAQATRFRFVAVTAGLSRDQDALLDLLADVVRRPRFDPAEAARARSETLAALERARNDPGTLTSWYIAKAVYEGHRFGLPLSGTPEKNELYVYDKTKRAAQRIASAVSYFETLWLDDDRLVYEGGVGKDGKLQIHDFATHGSTKLPTRHGAGLFGVPTLACEQAETGVDEEIGDESEGD